MQLRANLLNQCGCTHVYMHVVIGDIRNELVSWNDFKIRILYLLVW